MQKFIVGFEVRLKKWGVYIISLPLFLMATIEALNAMGRKLLVPFPCAIEAVESLMVITIYFGVSIVALEGGHVEVDLIARKFPRSVQNGLVTFANLVGTLTFGYLTCGAWMEAWNAIKILEMRMGVYRFPIWPFKVLFAFGMTLLTIQLAINVVKSIHLILGNTHYADLNKTSGEEVTKLEL